MRYKTPRRLPEANVQAHFYMRCQQEGIRCTLEYKIPGCRFDAVVHDDAQIFYIVEVKNPSERAYKKRIEKNKRYEQEDRYGAHGVPLIVIRGFREIEPAITKIKGGSI